MYLDGSDLIVGLHANFEELGTRRQPHPARPNWTSLTRRLCRHRHVAFPTCDTDNQPRFTIPVPRRAGQGLLAV